jgi:hypothetical protein
VNFAFRSAHLIKAEDYQELYGLRCWKFLGSDCSDSTAKSEIHIHVDTPLQPSGVVNPLMKAEYMSARYGGVSMVWHGDGIRSGESSAPERG